MSAATARAYRVHDLLRIDPCVAARWHGAPAWVAPALRRAPWVVVRRQLATRAIAIGVRGRARAERYAAELLCANVWDARVPEDLIACAGRDDALGKAFGACSGAARACGLSIAPIGAYGFEVASGTLATHADSDLDLLVRLYAIAFDPLQAFDAACRDITRALGITVDVELAYGDCGFALAEVVARRSSIIAKTPQGPRLVACPA